MSTNEEGGSGDTLLRMKVGRLGVRWRTHYLKAQLAFIEKVVSGSRDFDPLIEACSRCDEACRKLAESCFNGDPEVVVVEDCSKKCEKCAAACGSHNQKAIVSLAGTSLEVAKACNALLVALRHLEDQR